MKAWIPVLTGVSLLVAVSAPASAATAPPNVRHLSAAAAVTAVRLSWAPPATAGLRSIVVRRGTTSYPTSRKAGVGVPVPGVASVTVTDIGLRAGTIYRYSVFATYSSGLPGKVVHLSVKTRAAHKGSTNTVWTWGSSLDARRFSAAPTQVRDVAGAVAVAGSSVSAYALTKDGAVWAWGHGDDGELGDGTIGNNAFSARAVPVAGLGHVRAIAAGDRAAYALTTTGFVMAWGAGDFGQLGDGSLRNLANPVRVHGLSKVTAIAAFGPTAYAATADGRLWTWGARFGSAVVDTTPRLVASLGKVTAIGAARGTWYALTASGEVWSGGTGIYGQLGDGTSGPGRYSSTPVAVLGGVIAIAAGSDTGYVRLAGGQLWDWGSGGDDEIGNGADVQPSPAPVLGLSGVKAIGAGADTSYAVTTGGAAWSWGLTNYCHGPVRKTVAPQRIPGLHRVTALADVADCTGLAIEAP